MKKLLFLISFVILTICVSGQSSGSAMCVSVNCPEITQLPVDSALIFGNVTVPVGDTLSTLKWIVTGGTGVTLSTPTTSQTWVKGLNTPGIYTFSLTATTKHGNVMTNLNSQVTVIAAVPPPPPPRAVTSIQIMIDGVLVTIPLKGSLLTYGDGSTQQN